jgi:hypothetical protein
MNTTPVKDSRKAEIVTAIGLLVLLLGTATGNAFALLAMSLVALAVITIFYRQELRRHAWLVILAATATAVTVSFTIARF